MCSSGVDARVDFGAELWIRCRNLSLCRDADFGAELCIRCRNLSLCRDADFGSVDLRCRCSNAGSGAEVRLLSSLLFGVETPPSVHRSGVTAFWAAIFGWGCRTWDL